MHASAGNKPLIFQGATYFHKQATTIPLIIAIRPNLRLILPWKNTAKVNEEISKNQDVTIEFMTREQAAAIVDLSKLPEDASETLRIVRIGDYDACACIGAHVKNTSEIGTFKIISHSYADGVWRLRWKVIQNQ